MSKTDMIRDLRALTQAGLKDCKDALEECGWDLNNAIDLIKKKGQNVVSGSKIAAEGIVRAMHFGSDKVAGMVEVNCVTDFVARMPEMKSIADKCLLSLYQHILVDNPTWSVTPEIDSERKELLSKTKENIEVRRWWVEQFVGKHGKVFIYVHPNNEEGKIGVLLSLSASSEEVAESDKFSELGEQLAMQVAAMRPLAVEPCKLDPNIIARQNAIFEAQIDEMKKPEEAKNRIMEGKKSKWYKEVCLLDQQSVVYPKISVSRAIESVSKDLNGSIEVINFVRCEVGEGIEIQSEDFADEVNKMAGVL